MEMKRVYHAGDSNNADRNVNPGHVLEVVSHFEYQTHQNTHRQEVNCPIAPPTGTYSRSSVFFIKSKFLRREEVYPYVCPQRPSKRNHGEKLGPLSQCRDVADDNCRKRQASPATKALHNSPCYKPIHILSTSTNDASE